MKDSKFEPYEKVLVRDSKDSPWGCDYFSHYRSGSINPYYCTSHFSSSHCIPYEGNEHLLGTTDTPHEEEKESFKFGEHIEYESDKGVWERAIYVKETLDAEHNSVHKVVLKNGFTVFSTPLAKIRKAEWE